MGTVTSNPACYNKPINHNPIIADGLMKLRCRKTMKGNRIAIAALSSVISMIAATGSGVAYGAVRPSESDIGELTQSETPTGDVCVSKYAWTKELLAKGCFRKHGDSFQVSANSHFQTYIKWMNLLWNGREWRAYRQGTCFNKSGTATVVECNKDFYENTSVNY